MQNPIAIHARQVAERFLAALRHKNTQQGDWRMLIKPPEEQLERQGEKLLLAAEELKRKAFDLERYFNYSLTESQEDLRIQWQHKVKSPEVYDTKEMQEAYDAYLQSLDSGQQAQLQKINEARHQATHDRIKGTAFMAGVLTDDFALRAHYPDMPNHQAQAIVALLNAALHPLTHTATDMPTAKTGGLFRLREDDKAIGIKLYGKKGEELPLENIASALEQVIQNLSGADNWKRVKTPRGVGYIIRQPYYDRTAAFDVAHALSKGLQEPADARVIHYLDDAAVSEREFHASKSQGKEVALLLTGKAVEKILTAQLGVDIHRIKDGAKRGV